MFDYQQVCMRRTPAETTLAGVYILFKGEEVIYVGQSANVFSRLAVHLVDPGKDFDAYTIVPQPPDMSLNDMEAEAIMTLQPSCNHVLPKSKRYVAIARLKPDFDVEKKELDYALAHGLITPVYFKGRKYFRREELPLEWQAVGDRKEAEDAMMWEYFDSIGDKRYSD